MRRLSVRISLLLCALLLGSAASRAEKIVLFAGGGQESGNAPATKCQLSWPFGIAFDAKGDAFVVEMKGQRLVKIDAEGKLTALAGNGKKDFAGNDGPGPSAAFDSPHSLVVLPGGNILLADTFNRCVRKYAPATGLITAYAGTGAKGFSGDGGPAAQAQLGGAYCIALDPTGNRLLIDDLDNKRIRAVDLKSGVISTVAGNGKKGTPKDGAEAKDSPLLDPRAVAADQNGNIYILERGGNALRVVDSAGKIRTVAGTGQKGFSGDDGDALKATFNGPKHLCVAVNGDVLIADTENHAVRRYSPATGKITRVAGTGKIGSAGVGGDPLHCELHRPHGVSVDSQGNIYIADSENDRVLRIEK